MVVKMSRPLKTATEILQDSGLSGDAGDVLETVNEITEALMGAHDAGFLKALQSIRLTVFNTEVLDSRGLLYVLDELIGDAEKEKK